MQWITTDDIRRETWARLLNFANSELCFDAIVRRHGTPADSSTKSNYQKQALQIRVSLLQAREYFRAAEVATVFTRPNLLYYGMISLASASMLMNGDGTYSLDELRRNKANKTHGLDFTTGITPNKAGIGTMLLEHSHVSVLRNGFFLNWYRNTRRSENVYARVKTHDSDTTRLEYLVAGNETNASTESMYGRTYALLELLCQMPDLYIDAAAAGLPVVASRVNYDIEVHRGAKTQVSQWRIHGADTPESLLRILDSFAIGSEHSSLLRVIPEEPTTHCVVRLNREDSVKALRFRFPGMRETMANDQIIFGVQSFDVPEYAQQFMLMYALSMFARYLPDLWIRCIDSHCKSARLIERMLTEAEKKFPIMILGLLAGDDIVISTHRPGWQD